MSVRSPDSLPVCSQTLELPFCPRGLKVPKGLWELAVPPAGCVTVASESGAPLARISPPAAVEAAGDNLPKELSHDFPHGQEFRRGL